MNARASTVSGRFYTPAMPRRRGLAAIRASGAAVLLALGLSSCTTRPPEQPQPAAEPTSPGITEHPPAAPTAVPSTLARSVAPAPLISTLRARTLTSSPWTLVAISPDGRTLSVRANQGGGCDSPAGMEVTQTSSEVEVASLYTENSPPPGEGCAAYLATPLWTIQLTQPLGNRPLVHAPAVGATP